MLVIVGESPPIPMDPAFTGPSGTRLAKLFGVPLDELRSRAHLLNLFIESSGDGWDPGAAERAAQGVLLLIDSEAAVIMLGKRVCRAFMPLVSRPRWFATYELQFSCGAGHKAFSGHPVPHPSYRNRFWNDAAHQLTARNFLTDLLELYGEKEC